MILRLPTAVRLPQGLLLLSTIAAFWAATPVLSESVQLPVNVNVNAQNAFGDHGNPHLNFGGGGLGIGGGIGGGVGGGIGGGAGHAPINVNVGGIGSGAASSFQMQPIVQPPNVPVMLRATSPQFSFSQSQQFVAPQINANAPAPNVVPAPSASLISPTLQTQNFRTSTGQDVTIGRGAQVLVREEGGRTRIQNLTGTGKQVQMQVRDAATGAMRTMTLDPGTELVTSNKPLTAADIHVADGIARRNTTINGNMGISEIELLSVLRQTPALSRIITNPSNKNEKSLGSRLLKTMAALVTVRGNNGFQFGEAPPAVAPAGVQSATNPATTATAQTGPTGATVDNSIQQQNQANRPAPQIQIASDATRQSLFNSHTNRQVVRSPEERRRSGANLDETAGDAETAGTREGTPARNLIALGNPIIAPPTATPSIVLRGAAANDGLPHTGFGAVADSAVHEVETHPAIAIFLLLLFAIMLGIMTLLAATARKRAKELEVANRMLNEQMNERLRADAEVARLNTGLHAKIDELNTLNDELTQTRDKAVEASRLKSEFVANISHEIRTPITAVLGMIGLLKDSTADSKQGELVQMLEESARSLLSVINDILDFSKIEAGMLLIQNVDFSLRSALRESMDVLSATAAQKDIDLRLEVDEDVPGTVRGDPFRLRQVLLNLMGNAIKFTSEGYVLVKVSGAGPVSFTVEDTGIGISEDARSRLFQPFAQADGTTTRRFGGTGLGLSITKRLVQLMGGQIDFESEPGKGSKFWFTLPFDEPEALPPAAAPPPPAAVAAERTASGVTSRRVLVAEDSPVLQKIVKHQLASLKCDVTIAANGVEAVEAMKSGQFDLVLMDWQMPELDGIQATKEIRGLDTGGNIPIIAMTANAMEGDRAACLNAGMNDYISKPFSIDQLKDIISTWLPNDQSKAS